MPGLAKSDAAAISGWLQTDAGVAPDRAEAAGRELAASWGEGDLAYQTGADILGDHLTDDEPRPKLLADDLAAAFSITLED
ncbi:hypothetical protein [Amycolatopsis sp. TNS106]|uniref:hypothetical protein n=1 Tax=Amycolatopsis sp. TNS106 TaxID=2861750 RepID=UPI001C567A2E|nr:hypothetical protein [Amycolatopsis sp. TNS106]QXV63564.1 hypothetical protein CVV72_41115 [Amycolatopsis sp. TNS106]